MRIRRAVPDDAAAAAEVYIASRKAAAAYVPNTVHSEEEDRWFVREILIATTDTWLAESGTGELTAILSLRQGWIDQLYVHPDSAGQGVGTALVRLAKRLHPSGLELWTFQSNTGAQRFYERHGFTAVERTDGALNEERAPDIRYRWPGDRGST